MSPTVLFLSFSISNGMLFYAATTTITTTTNTTTQSLLGVDWNKVLFFRFSFAGSCYSFSSFFHFFFLLLDSFDANDSHCYTQKQKNKIWVNRQKKTVPFSLPMRFVSFLSLFLGQTPPPCDVHSVANTHLQTKYIQLQYKKIYNELATKTNQINPLRNSTIKTNAIVCCLLLHLYTLMHTKIKILKINSPHLHCYP